MMTQRLSIGLFICGALLLSVGATSSSAGDCKANLLGYSWQCKLQNVENHGSMEFKLSFYNQSVAQIDIPSLQLQAAGPFACEMRPRFFGRELVSGRSFLASLLFWFNDLTFEQAPPIATLTGDSYRHWILNGNALISNALNISVVVPTEASTNGLTNASAFVYGCGKPTPLDPF